MNPGSVNTFTNIVLPTETSRLKSKVNVTTSTLALQHESDPWTHRVPNSLINEDVDVTIHRSRGPGYGLHGTYPPLERAPTMWRPFWLRKTVLTGFLLFYTVLLAGLLIVKYFSDKYNGFFVADSTSRYTWTYGPTAVLVLAASLWHQVDYHCKTLSPWSEMYKGSAPAAKTILLDLVSPLTLVTAIKAARSRNLPVFATVAGYGLLKLITVFSTGLFVLSTATSSADCPMIINTKFDASRFNLTQMQNSAVSTDPVYAYYGNLKQGLPLAAGVAHNLSYATFELPGPAPSNATLTAEVDAMIPEYNCTVLKPEFDFVNEFDSSFYTHIQVDLPSGIVCQQWSDLLIPFADPRLYTKPPRELTSDWEPFVSCNDTNIEDSALKSDIALYYFTDIRYQQTPVLNQSDDGTRFTNVSWDVTQLTTVACLASHRIVKLSVSNDTTTSLGPTLSISNSTTGRMLPGFNTDDISQIYSQLIQTSDALPLSTLMALSQDSTDIGLFSDAETLKAAAQVTFKGVMSQWTQVNLKAQTAQPIAGSVAYTMNRLYVNSISLWAMVVGFALLMLATVALLLTTNRRVVSTDPNTIGAVASILIHSKDLSSLLSEGNAHNDSMLQQQLSAHSYHTVIDTRRGLPAFRIEVVRHHQKQEFGSRKPRFRLLLWLLPSLKSFRPRISSPLDCDLETRETTTTSPKWRPLTLSITAIILTFAIPFTMIVALEVLQHSSDRHDGIFDVGPGSDKYVRYIPALAMLLISTLFSALDFNVSTFAGYSTLYTGAAFSKSTIISNFVGGLHPVSLLKAARIRQFGVFASTTAALVGSILPIIVSGLYTVQNVDSQASTRILDRIDTFNLSWSNSSANDNSAATVLSLIEHLNLGYPELTYSEIALPALSLGDWEGSLKSGSILTGPSSASVPALRANLRCTMIPKSNITVWTEPFADIQQESVPSAFVNATFSLPSECQLGGDDGRSPVATYTNQLGLRDHGGAYAGTQIDLNFGPGTVGITYPGPIHGDAATADNPPGCPSLAFTFGYFDLNSTDKVNVTAMICFQEMQQVQTNITLTLNSTQIDPAHPPMTDESSVKTLENEDSRGTSFQYRIQNNIENYITVFPDSGFEAKGFPDYTLSIFFQAILGGKEKIAPELLVGPENEQRLFDAINHFYRKYMAQVINANMRNGCAGPIGTCSSVGDSGFTKGADVVDSEQGLSNLTVGVVTPRLVQNAAPKLALQIMLGSMIACGVFAFWFTRMRNTLPYNPWSIAGTMGLLAGSELCRSRHKDDGEGSRSELWLNATSEGGKQDLIPAGAEWMSNRELDEVFGRYRYSLGWWQRGDGSRRYGVDIGVPTATGSDAAESHRHRQEKAQNIVRRLVPRARKGDRSH